MHTANTARRDSPAHELTRVTSAAAGRYPTLLQLQGLGDWASGVGGGGAQWAWPSPFDGFDEAKTTRDLKVGGLLQHGPMDAVDGPVGPSCSWYGTNGIDQS